MATSTPSRRTIKKYGWRPDLPDQRDLLYAVPTATMTSLPPKTDLRNSAPELPPLFNQGDLGSCTANASATAVPASARALSLAPAPSARAIAEDTPVPNPAVVAD